MIANVIDVIIVLALIMGGIVGYKSGFFKSSIEAVGAIGAIILAFYLKNFIAPVLFKICPFFNYGGPFSGLVTLNIFLYEAIAFIIVYILLMVLVKVIVKLTEKFEKVLDFTVILGIPSKIFGALFGVIETYCVIFVLLFVFAQFSISAVVLHNSHLTNPILSYTPILSHITNDSYQAFKEVYNMKQKYKKTGDMDAYNLESLDVMLKYEIVTPEDIRDLQDRKKLNIKNMDSVVKKYEVQ